MPRIRVTLKKPTTHPATMLVTVATLPPADALPSDTSNTAVKNAIRLHLDFTNMLLLILCIIHLLRNESN